MDYPLRLARKIAPFPRIIKSFIDQACSAKMAGYWPSVSIYKHAKKNWSISSHLDRTSLGGG